MTQTALLLMGASMLGAFDVFYFHLFRLRLYRQPGSVYRGADPPPGLCDVRRDRCGAARG